MKKVFDIKSKKRRRVDDEDLEEIVMASGEPDMDRQKIAAELVKLAKSLVGSRKRSASSDLEDAVKVVFLNYLRNARGVSHGDLNDAEVRVSKRKANQWDIDADWWDEKAEERAEENFSLVITN